MSYRHISAVIVSCLIQFACTTDAPRPAPVAAQAAVAAPTLTCETPATAQLTMSDNAAESLACGPCPSGYGCQCGEDFCTRRGVPCP